MLGVGPSMRFFVFMQYLIDEFLSFIWVSAPHEHRVVSCLDLCDACLILGICDVDGLDMEILSLCG